MNESRTETLPVPPVASSNLQVTRIHDVELADPYAWMRERESPEVLAHLEAENAYTERIMAHTEKLREALYREMVGRIQETDQTVPVRIDDHFYYSRTVEGLQYPIHCRKVGSLEAPEEVLLDLNELAEGKDYLRLGVFEVSPDHRLLAYSLDHDGSERHTLRVLDLESREELPEVIENTGRSLEWAEDSRSFYYSTLDETRRPDKALHHRLGDDPSADEVVYHEADGRFFLSLFKTRSRRFLGIDLSSHTTSEVRYFDQENPEAGWRLLAPRRQDVEMTFDHHSDFLYVLTNEEARNFRLMRVPIATPERERWEEVVPHREEVKLDGVDLFRRHLVLTLRSGGLRRLRIRDLESGEEHEVAFDDPAYTVHLQGNPEHDTGVVRFAYTSLVTPLSVYDYDMASRERTLRKRTEVLGGYDPERYRCERIEATAADGVRVPMSLVYRRGLRRDGTNPALLYGYGSYGVSSEPRFSSTRLSLIDRGFVFAIAHVRGGGELGRGWYEDGKLLAKRNTFGDFVAAAERLIADGYTAPSRLAIRGGSAGGLLIGAVLNQRPELFAAAVAEVPFVDVVNTMLDPSIPLTVIEYEEWGNPEEKDFFDYIRSYSPYDNVGEREYPHLLITGGLHDPRVQYWEPTKWAARLRERKTDGNRVLLKIDLGSGHAGASGRYDALREEAFKQAFLLDILEVGER